MPDNDDGNNDQLLDAISGALPPLLNALDVLGQVGRQLHPPNLPALAAAVADRGESVANGLARFREAQFPDGFETFKACVEQACVHTVSAFDRLAAAANDPNGATGGYRALRDRTRALKALYPVSNMLPPVSRFFVSRDRRDDRALQQKIADADASRDEVGIMHASVEDWARLRGGANEAGSDTERGAFSLYVPEYYDASRSWPLVVALHGGSGNGPDFLWTWLVEARTRGAIVLSPSSVERTWSLMGRDVDSDNLAAMVSYVAQNWNVDSSKVLMTGMSDGGTFCYVSGLQQNSPFTHLAPSSASFHPLLVNSSSPERLAGLPIYLMHGVLDWMFPVDIARTAHATLAGAGANVVYREIGDLSHTWPSDENARIMDWLLGGAEPAS